MPQLNRRSSTALSVAVLLLAMASFQSGASIAKTMFPLVGPAGMVTLRIGFGTLILCVALRPWRARITGENVLPLLGYGISLGAMNLFFYSALSRIPLGIAVALEFSGPLAVAVLTSRRAADFAWIVLACGGLLLLLPWPQVGPAIDALGVLYSLGAGACWALYIVFGQRAGAHHGAQTVALGSLISALFVVPIGVASAGAALLSREVVLPGLAVAILSTALPYSLEMFALTRLPARTFGILMSIEPAFGAVLGFVYLRERLTSGQWTAIALIIAASIGTATTAPQKVAVPSD